MGLPLQCSRKNQQLFCIRQTNSTKNHHIKFFWLVNLIFFPFYSAISLRKTNELNPKAKSSPAHLFSTQVLNIYTYALIRNASFWLKDNFLKSECKYSFKKRKAGEPLFQHLRHCEEMSNEAGITASIPNLVIKQTEY